MRSKKGWKHTKETKRKISKAHKGKKLSKEHRKKISFAHLGKNPWNKGLKKPQGNKCHFWKGGKIIESTGYVYIYMPSHPYCNKKRYVAEHRLVMEKHLGRILLPKERIHHINSIKIDNRIENLMLFTNESKHQKYHWKQNS